MFFPCTQLEEILLFPIDRKQSLTRINESEKLVSSKQYMTKPTVLMCNPNALYY